MRAIKFDRTPTIAAFAIFAMVLALFVFYLHNLIGWQIFDDEGEYLYQVWRMTRGEVPYVDFLTPQLPLFLYAGRAVMELAGVSLFTMRLYSVLLAFGSGLLLFIAGRRHGGIWVGGVSMLLFLLHPDVFRETRIFRNEPIFLLFVSAGLLAGTWAKQNLQRRHLVWAGLFFGLATMSKLFGLLPAAGLGLWLLWDWWQKRKNIETLIRNGLAFGVPFLIVPALAVIIFTWFAPEFLDLVLGHHLAQGSHLTLWQVLSNKVQLYVAYFKFYPVLIGLGIISAVHSFIRKDARQRWALQLPTALAFLVISREFGQRHFMYLLPALCLLAGWLLARGLRGDYRWAGRVLSIAALLFILAPAIRANAYRASWVDHETVTIVALIQEHTEPGDVIVADDIGLAYYARRPTTYSGAALSHGAATSGQITGEILIDEIVQDNVRMVLVDTSLLTGNHMVFLRDYPRFHRFLQRNFDHLGNYARDYQKIDVWWREEHRPFHEADQLQIQYEDGTHFGENIKLLGYRFDAETLRPGETLSFTLFWQANGPVDHYWSVFAHLIGPDGTLMGQHDKVPYEGVYPTNRWRPGQIIDDHYRIEVPADAPAGAYHIVVGMYDWQTQERLSLRTGQGNPLSNNQRQLPQRVEIVR